MMWIWLKKAAPSVVMAALGLTMVLWAAESKEPTATAPADRAGELRQQLQDVLTARDSALRDLAESYRTAAPESRTDLEALNAQLQRDYEETYLSLLVEYHRETGNTTEQQRAERMLDALHNGSVPLSEAARTLPSVTPTGSREGVVTDAQ